MIAPTVDKNGKPLTERDKKLAALLVRPTGAQKYELNAATMKRVAAYSFVVDTKRLAAKLGGKGWADPRGLGDTRRFGITLL
jgi:hypothetical protein